MPLRTVLQRIDVKAAGLLAGLALAFPAHAASFDPRTIDWAALPARDWVLMASLVLLAVAVALRLMRRDTAPDAGADAPDLRWWRRQ